MISMALPVLLLALGAAALPAQDGGGELPGLPQLPAPLAWLVDQDDHPLVSRHLVVLEPGGEAPRTVLDRLLYSFDAADLQAVGWVGDVVYVNGARPLERPSPNVSLPLHALRWTRDGFERLGSEREASSPQRFATSSTGSGLVVFGLAGLGYLEPGATAASETRWLLNPEAGLGRAQLRTALWMEDGRGVYASVRGQREGMQDGLWQLRMRVRDDGSCDGFGAPVRVADTVGVPRQALHDGALLAVQRTAREFYAPRRALRVWPGSDRSAETLVEDLHWNEQAAFEPLVLGRAERPSVPLALAYVRHGDGALMLRREGSDGGVTIELLWQGERASDGITWSPGGRWIALHAQDEARESFVHVVEVETGAVYRLGPGLRPAWGPSTE